WWIEHIRWLRRERPNRVVTRTRESSVRFSSRLKKITYSTNGDALFQEIRCLEGDDLAEEISIHVPESDCDDQETTVYGDIGRPKTASPTSSYGNPEVVVHPVPHLNSSIHLHPYRTMSTRSHKLRSNHIRPSSPNSPTGSISIPHPSPTFHSIRNAWSDPNLA
ncbi:hypothetical protein PFISCL1PPCAC_27228, partial [Pristionchus fissidentatus]